MFIGDDWMYSESEDSGLSHGKNEGLQEDNIILPDEDFDGIFEDNTDGISKDKCEEKPQMEKIIKEIDITPNDTKEKIAISQLPKGILSYINRNKIFLIIIFITWLLVGVDYSYEAYRIPIIGTLLSLFNRPGLVSIIRFFTATYNGPMSFGDFMKPTFFGYIVALVAKPVYLLAMTGVIIPFVKSFIRKDKKPLEDLKNSVGYIKSKMTSIVKEPHSIALIVAGVGIAIFMTNILNRNGKFDKGFVPILMSFVLLLGVSSPLPSLLDKAIRKGISLFIMLLPGRSSKPIDKQRIIRVGMALGFILGLFTGYIGEFFNLYLGAIIFGVGVIASMFVKEKKLNDN